MTSILFLGGMTVQMTSFLQDKQLTIALSGEIDHHGARSILRTIADKIDQYMPVLCILDFKAVTFMDSSGIAIVIHTYRRMCELQGTLRIKRVPPQPLKVLLAAGMDRIVSVAGREPAYEV